MPQQLDRERIAAAALRVLDAQGLGGFTIRGVSDELGVSPMAIYHYVRNKAELVTLLVDRTATQALDLPRSGDWRKDIQVLARFLRKSAMDHPALFDLQQTYRVWSPAIVQVTALWVSCWRASGLPDDKALIAANVSGMAMGGLIWQASRSGDIGDFDPPDFGVKSIAAKVPSVDSGEVFELGVRAIMDGLYAQLSVRGPGV